METILKHETKLVNTYSPTRHGQKVRAITVHHEAGNLTSTAVANVFKNRKSSANYSIDVHGGICLHVPEEFRAWTTGGINPDDYSITIELANDRIGGDWHISDNTINAAATLCADICRRYDIPRLYYDGKRGTLLRHCDFQATACPGPYFKSKTEEFCNYVNYLIEHPDGNAPVSPTNAPNSTIYHVQVGAFTNKENAEKYAENLKKQGISATIKTEKKS